MFLLSVLVVLMLVTTVATSLSLYFQVLCQVLALLIREPKVMTCCPTNTLCLLHEKLRQKSPDHLFDLNFLTVCSIQLDFGHLL